MTAQKDEKRIDEIFGKKKDARWHSMASLCTYVLNYSIVLYFLLPFTKSTSDRARLALMTDGTFEIHEAWIGAAKWHSVATTIPFWYFVVSLLIYFKYMYTYEGISVLSYIDYPSIPASVIELTWIFEIWCSHLNLLTLSLAIKCLIALIVDSLLWMPDLSPRQGLDRESHVEDIQLCSCQILTAILQFFF